MNKEQFESEVVRKTLMEIPRGYSEKAVLAIMMIVAHESARCQYIKQVGGPALGVIQMEPATHDDVWKHSDSIWDNAVEVGIIDSEHKALVMFPSADRLVYDLRYCVFMARQRLFMDVNPLPDNEHDMSIYLKNYWNSAEGAADSNSYLHDYEVWK